MPHHHHTSSSSSLFFSGLKLDNKSGEKPRQHNRLTDSSYLMYANVIGALLTNQSLCWSSRPSLLFFVKQGKRSNKSGRFQLRYTVIICVFLLFCPHVKRKKQQNLQLRTWRTFNSTFSPFPFLFSSPTFPLKTLTLCNDSLSRYGTHQQSSYLFSLSYSSEPVSWTAASHVTVANDFYVNIFIRIVFKELLVMQRDFRIFFSIKDPFMMGKN